MIKDIAENANAMRLKIAFSLNHIKMCLKILSWKRRERKVYLICIFFSCKKVSEKTGEKKFGRTESVLVFELQPFHHLTWGLAQ